MERVPRLMMATTLSEIKLATPALAVLHVPVAPMPVFAEGESARLHADPSSTITSEDGGVWRGLVGWLQPPPGSEAPMAVQVRSTGVTVRLEAGAPPSTQLLPLDTGSLQADLVFRNPTDGQEHRIQLQPRLDAPGRSLTLATTFATDPAGRDRYGRVVDGVSDPSARAAVELSYTHRYQVRVPAPQPGGGPVKPGGVFTPGGGVFDPIFASPGGVAIPGRVFGVDRAPVIARIPGLAARLTVFSAARALPTDVVLAGGAAARPSEAAVVRPVAGIRPELVKEMREVRPDFRQWVIADVGAGEGPTVKDGTLTHGRAIDVTRSLDDESAFPDLPRQRQHGWGQVSGREGRPTLYFRDSDRADSFFYLPTAFKLGFHLEAGAQDETVGRPPMRSELYRDADSGEYRVKVTLVALPSIEDADREALRAHIRDSVLARTLPFVGLELRAGLQAAFLSEFSSGPADDQRVLPASIRFVPTQVRPDDVLELQFQMEAWDYAIFCELLSAGLSGRVALSEPGLEASIPVRLHLDDIVTNAIRVQAEGFDVADEEEGPEAEERAEAEEAPSPGIGVSNLLRFPVRASSLRVTLVDRGAVPGMVFDAEDVDLLPGGGELPAAAEEPSKNTFPVVPQHIAFWDDTVVVPGTLQVQGGSPADWLDRVHRDPSLEPHRLRVSIQPVIPAAGAARVQLVGLRVFRDGDPEPRTDRQVLPAEATDLSVEMTLGELAGLSGAAPTFSLEFDCVYADGSLSLAQRVELDPSVTSLPLPILIESAGSEYTVEAAGTRQVTDRPGAAALVERLRGEGKRWRVFATTPVEHEGPTGPTEPDTQHEGSEPPLDGPEPAGPEVTLVADLLSDPFASGSLSKVFVELQADDDTAPGSTVRFDPGHTESQTWSPAGGTIPPFRYKVTYLYREGAIRQAEGVKADLLLVLDPESAS